jgi:hypothetical protein
VRQRQGAADLDLAEREAGVQVLHVRQVQQHVERQARERIEVGRHHLQLEGARARDVVAGDHLGDAADRVLELARRAAGVAVGVDAHEGEHPQSDLAAVDLGAVAGDEALRLEPLHAPPGRCRRQADARGQFGVRQACVLLQLAQDGDVEPVERGAVRVGRLGRRDGDLHRFRGFPWSCHHGRDSRSINSLHARSLLS